MFSQVIAGVDGKTSGRDAAVLAHRLLAPDGQLTLVNVYPEQGVLRDGVNFAEIVREECLAMLRSERSAIGVDGGVEVLGARSVGAGLHHVSRERNADLLVVGSSSYGALGRVLLGNDMRASLEGATCAVAVAPRGFAARPGGLATIGVAYDGSVESEAALALARDIAEEHGAAITALTVVNVPTYSYGPMMAVDWSSVINDLEREAQERLALLAGVQGRAVQGLTSEELERFGEEVDLLLVGSRAYGPARRMLFGSTSDYLARHARCPLIVLRRGIDAHGEPSRPTAGAASA